MSAVHGGIAGHHGATPLRQIGGQHILRDDFQPRLAPEPHHQLCHEFGIYFDRIDLVGALQQLLCEKAFSGSNFDDL